MTAQRWRRVSILHNLPIPCSPSLPLTTIDGTLFVQAEEGRARALASAKLWYKSRVNPVENNESLKRRSSVRSAAWSMAHADPRDRYVSLRPFYGSCILFFSLLFLFSTQFKQNPSFAFPPVLKLSVVIDRGDNNDRILSGKSFFLFIHIIERPQIIEQFQKFVELRRNKTQIFELKYSPKTKDIHISFDFNVRNEGLFPKIEPIYHILCT